MKTYFSLKRFLKLSSANPAPEPTALTPRDMLLADIEKTQNALEIAYSNFDNVTDPDLIDCYIYEVNSALKRYRFLLQQASLMQEQEKPDTPKDDFIPEHELVSQLCPIPSSLSVHQN